MIDRVHGWVAVVSAVVVLAVGAAPATAQDGPSDETGRSASDREAQTRFEAGRLAFEAGRYEDALEDFLRAYELSNRVRLLHNIAVCYDRLRRDEQALAYFERYLEEAGPGADAAAEVRGRIAVLRAERADPPEGERAPPPSPEPAPRAADATAGWAVVAASGAALVGGAVLLGVGLADRASVEGAQPGVTWEGIRQAYDRGPILEAVGIAALAAGAAGAALGVVLVVTAGSPSERSAEVVIVPGGLALRGRL